MSESGLQAVVSDGGRAVKPLPLFFRQLKVLDSTAHRHLRLKPHEDWAFCRGSNAIPLTFSEIPRAAQEYPVVFAGDGDRLHVVALVGLTEGTNLLVNGDGGWQGRYQPAYLRSYPFALGRSGERLLVAFDPGAVNLSETNGAALFDGDGARTPTLEKTVEFLRQYEVQMDRARSFVKKLSALGLLVPVSADIRLRSGARFEMSGLRVVERGALKRLPDAAKLELFDGDWLEMIHHHFASLQTFSTLVDRLAEHKAAETGAGLR